MVPAIWLDLLQRTLPFRLSITAALSVDSTLPEEVGADPLGAFGRSRIISDEPYDNENDDEHEDFTLEAISDDEDLDRLQH